LRAEHIIVLAVTILTFVTPLLYVVAQNASTSTSESVNSSINVSLPNTVSNESVAGFSVSVSIPVSRVTDSVPIGITILTSNQTVQLLSFRYYDLLSGIQRILVNRVARIEFFLAYLNGTSQCTYVRLDLPQLGYSFVRYTASFNSYIYVGGSQVAFCSSSYCSYDPIPLRMNTSVTGVFVEGAVDFNVTSWSIPANITATLTLSCDSSSYSWSFVLSVVNRVVLIPNATYIKVPYGSPAAIGGTVVYEGTNVTVPGERIDVYRNRRYVQTVYSRGEGSFTVVLQNLPPGSHTVTLDPEHGDPVDVVVEVEATAFGIPTPTIAVPVPEFPAQIGLVVERPGLYSPQSLLILALFLGVFVIYSKLFGWAQALAVASAISLAISVALLGTELVAFFLVLLVLGLALWRVLGK